MSKSHNYPTRGLAATGAAVCLLLLASACSSATQNAAGAATSQARATRTALPTRAVSANAAVTADGALTLASPAVSLAFESAGKVTSVRVMPGQSVKKGAVLATLDDTALLDAVADAQLALRQTEATIKQQYAPPSKAELAAAQAALSSASASYGLTKAGTTQSELESARRNWEAAWLQYLTSQIERDVHCGTPEGTASIDCKMKEASYGNTYESMLAAKASYEKAKEPVTKETLTQAQTAVVSAKARLDALTAEATDETKAISALQLAQAKAALARARENLSKATLTAPCDCVVQSVNIAVGAAPGGAAVVLVDPSKLQFRTSNLVERDVVALRAGSTATIRLKAHADALTGKVTAVLAQSAGTQSGSALYTVLIGIDPVSLVLLPGMTGQAEIAVR